MIVLSKQEVKLKCNLRGGLSWNACSVAGIVYNCKALPKTFFCYVEVFTVSEIKIKSREALHSIVHI